MEEVGEEKEEVREKEEESVVGGGRK